MHILKQYKLHLTIIIAWLVMYAFNYAIFNPLIYKSHISFIFLPAGIRIIFATIYRKEAWIGLFLGAIITGFLFLESNLQPYVLLFSAMSATSPILAVYSVNAVTPLGGQLEYLDIKKVIAISVMYGIYCGIFHNLTTFYLFGLSLQTFITDSFAMFIGDMTGSFILLTILASQRHRILQFLNSRGIT